MIISKVFAAPLAGIANLSGRRGGFKDWRSFKTPRQAGASDRDDYRSFSLGIVIRRPADAG
jgi:hypothetical protein